MDYTEHTIIQLRICITKHRLALMPKGASTNLGVEQREHQAALPTTFTRLTPSSPHGRKQHACSSFPHRKGHTHFVWLLFHTVSTPYNPICTVCIHTVSLYTSALKESGLLQTLANFHFCMHSFTAWSPVQSRTGIWIQPYCQTVGSFHKLFMLLDNFRNLALLHTCIYRKKSTYGGS